MLMNWSIFWHMIIINENFEKDNYIAKKKTVEKASNILIAEIFCVLCVTQVF